MKKILKYIIACVAMLPTALGAQTQSENHVVSKTYKIKSTAILNTQNPDSVTTAIQYFDGLGRAKQSVLVKGGKSDYGNNEILYDWSIGQPTNSGFYNLNGLSVENQIVNGTTPFGDIDLLWECINSDTSNNADGGWNTDEIYIDKTKAYRYTIWVKKSVNRTDGLTYHGVKPHQVKNLDGTVNTNPYFWSGYLPVENEWYLIIGYIHPENYTGADTGISGVYDAQGNKILDGLEFKWNATASAYFRNYLYYASNTSTRQYFWSPVVQKIDGSETSITELATSSPTVFNNAVVDAKDIVTHFEYDGLGRQTKEYLPYASSSSDGRFHQNAGLATQGYYKGRYANDFTGTTSIADVNSFSEKVLENSPLNRPLEQTAPGEAWKKGSGTVTSKGYSNGNSIKLDYNVNTSSEVKYYSVNTTFANNTYTPSLQGGAAYYGVGELTKTVTKDENWTESQTNVKDHTTEEFTNKQGQVILKRTYNNNVTHDTYYVYDRYGNLSYVLPPKVNTADGVSASELAELCYQYKYDTRNRLVEKKIPGKGWECIVYDKLDRPVLTQDAIQKTQNKWLYTKYDKLGRVSYTGEYTNGATRTSMQTTVNTFGGVNLYEQRTGQTLMGGAPVYYTANSYPNTTSLTVFTVNYYDSYIDLPSGFTAPTIVYDHSITTNTKGLATVSKTKILGTTHWITTLTYYDELARPVYVYSYNEFLQTTDIVESKLDFTGKVLETKTTHKKTGKTDIVTIDRFEYDHQDRLLAQTQKVADHITERIVRNNYDDLGQLTSKLNGNATPKGYTDVTSGITITDDIITKVSGAGWNEGLATLGSFNADGYVEFETLQTGKYVMVGLSDVNTNAHYGSIDYAIYIHASDVYIYEFWSNLGLKTDYQVGDAFRVERVGSTIYYKKNGEVFYTSNKVSTGALLGDVSMFHNGGQIKDLHIVDNENGLQNVDYNYNVRGWLKNINQDTHSDNDLFNFTLRYNDPTSGTALFNGNISQTSWNTSNTDASTKTYTYTYDALNRITAGDFNVNTYDLLNVAYDKNGNITSLSRNKHSSAGGNDAFTYLYDAGNKLTSLSGTTAGTFSYDVNGNMKTDSRKNITGINYNHLNLPTQVTIGGSNIDYVYDAAGMKQRKIVSGVTTDYAGNHVYENGTLQFFNHAEGYVKVDNGVYDYVYQYKDHLGNVRLSYSDANGNGSIAQSEIIEESNYYPFGLKHKGYNNVINGTHHPYGYGGKEEQEELGLQWLDFHARNYDAALGRWMNLDPLAESFYEWSPYNYSFNSPMVFVDPTGMGPESTHLDKDGNVIAVIDDGDTGVYQHGDNADGGKPTEYMIKRRQEIHDSTGANGTKVGETEHWDEFVSPETGKAMTNVQVKVGESWDGLIDEKIAKADGMDLKEIASKSGPGGEFDIKNDNPNEGRLLNGKYATSRSAGNYLAGHNAEGGTYFGVGISFKTFQKLAGALHVKGSLSTSDKAGIVLKGTSYGPAPTYGEVNYQYRMSKAGWNASAASRPKPAAHTRITTCFVAGTKVLMSDGTSKNIEDVKKGDKIMSVNMSSMSLEEDSVLEIPEVIKKYRRIELILDDGSKTEFSPAHPFWVVGKGWSVFDTKEAETELTFKVSKMEEGDTVLKLVNGKLNKFVVKSLRDSGEKIEMYNVEYVAKNNNFFANNVLVHNKRMNDEK